MALSGPLELWPISRIAYGLPASPKRAVIEALLDIAVKGLRVPAERKEKMLQALLDREKNGSTAAAGLAIPHVKLAEVKAPIAALGVYPAGIDFAAIDGGKVHSVFLLLSPAAMAEEHLVTLRWIAGVARNPDFMAFLRRTTTPADARSLLEEMGS
jgi:mannitol/fructose-specific phosphotransferase system IIA component (Ntr-type)